MNVGNCRRATATALRANAVTVSFGPLPSCCLRNASRSVMSARSCCVTCGIEAPGQAHLPGGRLADRQQRLTLDRPPLLEVRQRRRLHAGAAHGRRGPAGGQLADVRLDVLLDDAAGPAAAGHLRQVDAEFAGQAARGGAGRREAVDRRDGRGDGRGRLARRRGGLRPGGASCFGGGGSAAGSAFFAAAAAFVASPLPPLSRRQMTWPTLIWSPALTLHVGDAAGQRRRHVQGGLVGLDFEERLVLGHRLAGRQRTALTSTVSTFSFSAGSLISLAMSLRSGLRVAR